MTAAVRVSTVPALIVSDERVKVVTVSDGVPADRGRREAQGEPDTKRLLQEGTELDSGCIDAGGSRRARPIAPQRAITGFPQRCTARQAKP